MSFKIMSIHILDNVLPVNMANEIESITSSNLFPWYLLRDIQEEKLLDSSEFKVSSDKNTLNTIQMSHKVFDHENKSSQVNSELFEYTKTICDICCDKVEMKPQYIRMKYNLLFNNTKNKKRFHNTPHVDNSFIDNYSMIYYVNDSDGDTFIFNEIYNSSNPAKIKKLTVQKKISPKKNRVVIFSGRYFHASSNPIHSENRIVLNTNFFRIGGLYGKL